MRRDRPEGRRKVEGNRGEIEVRLRRRLAFHVIEPFHHFAEWLRRRGIFDDFLVDRRCRE
jgi:hypothetical protein